MTTARYELVFEIRPVSEEFEDRISECLDAVVASHSGVTTVAVLQEGPACLTAAHQAVAALRSCGAVPLRLVDDLVSRGEIARRAEVTPQAVGLWIRGERQAQVAFPKPYVLGSSELWLWGEVVTVLRMRGIQIDDAVVFPTRHDIQLIGGMVADGDVEAVTGRASHGSVTHLPVVVWGEGPRAQVPVEAAQTDVRHEQFAMVG